MDNLNTPTGWQLPVRDLPANSGPQADCQTGAWTFRSAALSQARDFGIDLVAEIELQRAGPGLPQRAKPHTRSALQRNISVYGCRGVAYAACRPSSSTGVSPPMDAMSQTPPSLS